MSLYDHRLDIEKGEHKFRKSLNITLQTFVGFRR